MSINDRSLKNAIDTTLEIDFMKNILVLLVILISSCAHRPIQIDRPLYWQAKKGDKVIKIFGTIHLNSDIIKAPEIVKQDIVKSDILYVESTKSQNDKIIKETLTPYFARMFKEMLIPYPEYFENLSETAKKNIRYMMNHPKTVEWLKQKNISHDISKDPVSPTLVYFVFMNYALKQDENNQVLRKLMIKEFIYTASLTRKVRSELINGKIMDVILEEQALQNSIPTKSLDSEFMFYKIMDSLPDFLIRTGSNPQELASRIIDTLFGDHENIRRYFSKIEDLLDLYTNADAIAISSLSSEIEENKNLLISERNMSWKKTLIRDQHKKISVAVGVLHLVGKDSLLKLLESDGYSIQRL